MSKTLERALQRFRSRPAGGVPGDVAGRISAKAKSRLGFELIAAVNIGRLKCYAADGSAEYTAFQREMELARIAYRPAGEINFYADQGHDDYLASLALAVDAAAGSLPAPRIARGRAPALAL